MDNVTTQISTGTHYKIDPTTGFIDYLPNPDSDVAVMGLRRSNVFTPTQKLLFLDKYRDTFPAITDALRIVGIDSRTLSSHLELDAKFKYEYENLRLELKDRVIKQFDAMGKNSRNFMDRIVVAKAMFPETFDRDKRIVVAHEKLSPEVATRRYNLANEAVDAEVVQAQYAPEDLAKLQSGEPLTEEPHE